MTIGILPGALAHFVQPRAVQGTATGNAAGALSADDLTATGLLDQARKLLPPGALPGRLEEAIRPKTFRPFV